MLRNKFIITSAGQLRLGRVHMHKELLCGGDCCIGGGTWEIDYVGMRLVLDGASYDYGAPQWSRLDVLYVSREYEGLEVVYKPSASSRALSVSQMLRVRFE